MNTQSETGLPDPRAGDPEAVTERETGDLRHDLAESRAEAQRLRVLVSSLRSELRVCRADAAGARYLLSRVEATRDHALAALEDLRVALTEEP